MIQIFAFIIGIAIGSCIGVGYNLMQRVTEEPEVEEVEELQPIEKILATSTAIISPAEISEPLPLPAIKYEDNPTNAVCTIDCPLIEV